MAVLEVEGLTVRFRTPRGLVHALTDAHFRVERGEVLVILGESGSGKTVLAHALMRLLPRNSVVTGKVVLEGISLFDLPESRMRAVRARRMALIPQSAGAALNPVRRVGPLLMELARGKGLDAQTARARLAAALQELDLPLEQIWDRYPHHLSGGMQQRVVNALAWVGKPAVVIADEPTFGLDADLVEVTASSLRRMAEQGAAVLVITHDLRLAQRLGTRVALIYASYIVELRDTPAFFAGPAHPYGRGLLQALPERGGIPIPGFPPELTHLPQGCPFAPRCSHRTERCSREVPPLLPLPMDRGAVRCVLYASG
ncbi:MAG: ABC transporter ATP-binding protein [Dehalococcoidia bacterium]|nr:ABC transporter ATP-binding protein [Dehalococcoidia bacterium]MDW8119712.1 ABC transporter ATP-binding protein [Chloroflexota bacterium]